MTQRLTTSVASPDQLLQTGGGKNMLSRIISQAVCLRKRATFTGGSYVLRMVCKRKQLTRWHLTRG